MYAIDIDDKTGMPSHLEVRVSAHESESIPALHS